MPHSHWHHHDVARGIIDKMEEGLGNQLSHKRDNHENKEMNNMRRDDPATVIQIVYKTLDPTFKGPVAGYLTLKQEVAQESTPAPTRAATPTGKAATKSVYHTEIKEETPIPTAIRPLTTSGLDTFLEQATGKPTLSSSMDFGDQAFVSPTPLQGADPAATSIGQSPVPEDGGSGTSAGTKAGIAFGVLGGVLIVGLIAFLLFSRCRRQAAAAHARTDNEKFQGDHDVVDTMTVRSDPHAPRISLRPVTQFLPNWSLDKRTSKGAVAALTPLTPPVNAFGQNGTRDRPSTGQSANSGNPFGGKAERVPEATIREQCTVPPSGPLPASGPAVAAASGAGSSDAGTLVRKTSMKNGGPKNLDLTVPPALVSTTPDSPANTEFSMTSISPDSAVPPSQGAAAIAAAGGPLISNVHRVQLDFTPSLDDEMEMKAGELVRLLHEYDDGWALCIRLDRSQQGVIPRTCLSTRPVKPRFPEGQSRLAPAVNPNGQSLNGPLQRPMSPHARSMTPQSLPQGQPLVERARSPGPHSNGPSPGFPNDRPQTPMDASQKLGCPPGAPPATQVEPPPQAPLSGPPTDSIDQNPVPGQAY